MHYYFVDILVGYIITRQRICALLEKKKKKRVTGMTINELVAVSQDHDNVGGMATKLLFIT